MGRGLPRPRVSSLPSTSHGQASVVSTKSVELYLPAFPGMLFSGAWHALLPKSNSPKPNARNFNVWFGPRPPRPRKLSELGLFSWLGLITPTMRSPLPCKFPSPWSANGEDDLLVAE